MNKEKIDLILDLNNNHIPNKYKNGQDLTTDFIMDAARTLNKGTSKKDRKIFFYHNKKEFGFINGLRAGTTSLFAYRICKDKFVTENWLNNMKISTLSSEMFSDNEHNLAIDYVNKYPDKLFVVKPINLSSGKGIIFNVNYTNIVESLSKSAIIQKSYNINNPSYIIQEFIDGFDVRICIAEGAFACALWRVPAHVVGNGKDTIQSLIEKKNSHRKSSVYFNQFLYTENGQMKEYIREQGFHIDSVPSRNQVVFLSYLGNLQAGAESVDVSHLVSKELIDIAVQTVAAIPGLYTAGVDILTESFDSSIGYVIEVNTNANNKVHYLPYYGDVQKPYVNIVRNMLIKHKVEQGIMLDINEAKIYKDIVRFYNFKDSFQSKAVKLLLD